MFDILYLYNNIKHLFTMPDFPSILPTTVPPATRLGAYLGYQTDRLMAFARRLTGLDTGEQICYVFNVNADEVGLRLYDRLLQAYLNRFPHRFTNGRVDEVPELVLALTELPGTELELFTMYVIGQLNQSRDRADFQYYHLVSDLLRQLLEHRPWGNEAGLRRIGEALYFTSPHGFDGVVYWPLAAYLRSVRASYGGRPLPEATLTVLDMMAGELRGYFAFGYTTEVATCRTLLTELLGGVLPASPRAAYALGWADRSVLQ